MSTNLYLIRDRELLKSLTAFDAGFHSPAVVLDGLTEEQAAARPDGASHSIADIVGHMCFWQDFFNAIVQNGFSGYPEHAPEGWPAMEPGGWEALRERVKQLTIATF